MTNKKECHPERSLSQSERRSRRTCFLPEVARLSENPAKSIQLACLTALWGLTATSQSLAACANAQSATVIHVDPILHQRWAITSDCEHPAHPARATPLSLPASEPLRPVRLQAPLAIHAGDRVRLWTKQQDLSIEITGIAEESGAIGSIIHIRLTQLTSDETAMQILGVVRGPFDVEMQP